MILDTGRLNAWRLTPEDREIWCLLQRYNLGMWRALMHRSAVAELQDAAIMFCLVDSSRDRVLKNG